MAYLQITLKVASADRAAAGAVYTKYKAPFLDTVQGATSKDLLVRDEDVQVLHGFDTVDHAKAYLNSDLFQSDVVAGLKPLLQADPEVRIYETA
uniref:ABM domain-containing protein n=1 Tax=Caulobacter sp. (strain K31) TaxID=366602 RepID=B0SV77_CAUSK